MRVMDGHDVTLAVKVALNPNTINHALSYFWLFHAVGFSISYLVFFYSLPETILNLSTFKGFTHN